MHEPPLSLELLPVATALRPGSVSAEHALIRLRAAAVPGGARTRLTAVLVIDVSGSMAGEPIAHVCQSAKRIVEILSDDDKVGVVAFSNAAATTSPIRAMTAAARGATCREIAGLTAGGGTNVSAALSHAAVSFPEREPDERQIILLLSDGQPNGGTASPQGLLAEARRVKARGVAISTLGYGVSHSEEVLIAIAEGGGGRYAFISDPRLATGNFARALGAQRDVVAEDVELTITPSEGVEIVRVYGDPPVAFGAGGLRVTLQDLVAGDELNVVVELRVNAPKEAGPWAPLAVAVRARHAGSTNAFAVQGDAVVAVTERGPFDERRDALVAVTIARADVMRTRARALGDARDFAGAVELLRNARDMVMQVPGFAPGGADALSDAYETLVDDIDMLARRPAETEYAAYKKASVGYNDFAQGGVRVRGGTAPANQPVGSQAMARQSVANLAPRAVLVRRVVGPDGVRSEQTVPITSAEFSIGRVVGNDLIVASSNVSKRHAMLVFDGNEYTLIDLGSTNGFRVNGAQAAGRVVLRAGDRITLGDVELEFQPR